MTRIIMVGYLSGIVYQLLCTNIIKLFASGSGEIVDRVMEDFPVHESKIKLLKLVADLIMFVCMIITIILWPIGIIYNLVSAIKNLKENLRE